MYIICVSLICCRPCTLSLELCSAPSITPFLLLMLLYLHRFIHLHWFHAPSVNSLSIYTHPPSVAATASDLKTHYDAPQHKNSIVAACIANFLSPDQHACPELVQVLTNTQAILSLVQTMQCEHNFQCKIIEVILFPICCHVFFFSKTIWWPPRTLSPVLTLHCGHFWAFLCPCSMTLAHVRSSLSPLL